MAFDYKGSLNRYRRYLQVVREKPLWGAGMYFIMSLALTIVLIVTALRPTLITISGLLGQMKQNREISQKMNEKIAAIQKASDLLDQNQSKLRLLDEALPVTTEWEKWAEAVTEAATVSGVELVVISLEKFPIKGSAIKPVVRTDQPTEAQPVDEVTMSQIAFTISGKGEFEQLKTFTEMVENMRRIVNLSDVTIGKDSVGGIILTLRGAVSYTPDQVL